MQEHPYHILHSFGKKSAGLKEGDIGNTDSLIGREGIGASSSTLSSSQEAIERDNDCVVAAESGTPAGGARTVCTEGIAFGGADRAFTFEGAEATEGISCDTGRALGGN